jgi:hypothetical protein
LTAAPQVSDDTLIAIFSTILDWHMTTQSFPEPIKALSSSLVSATLAVYSTAATKLLPTPTKSHYLFNLRDFERVVQVRAFSGFLCPSLQHHLTDPSEWSGPSSTAVLCWLPACRRA